MNFRSTPIWLALLFLACSCSTVSPHHLAPREKRAAVIIDELGGDYETGYRSDGSYGICDVDLDQTATTNDDLSRILLLIPEIEFLNLKDTRITDASAESLSRLKNPARINLSNTKVGWDTALVLIRFPELYEANLGGTDISDELQVFISEHLNR